MLDFSHDIEEIFETELAGLFVLEYVSEYIRTLFSLLLLFIILIIRAYTGNQRGAQTLLKI